MLLSDFQKNKKLYRVNLDLLDESPDWAADYRSWFRKFLAEAQSADEVFQYRSEDSESDLGLGSEGYVAVKNGVIIAEIVGLMN
jgi:hypothetical protein